jgi:hypothetical protein
MDVEQELWRLAGEALATQTVLTGLCIGLAQNSEAGHALVAEAFSFADSVVETGALKLGREQPRDHLEAFAKLVDQLRHAALGASGGPEVDVQSG